MSNSLSFGALVDALMSKGTTNFNVGPANFTVRFQDGYFGQAEAAHNVVTTILNFANSPLMMQQLSLSTAKVYFVNIMDSELGADSGGVQMLGGNIGMVNINVSDTDRVYLTENGEYVHYNIQHIVNHEVGHAITGQDDTQEYIELINQINEQTDGGPPRKNYEDSHCFIAGTPVLKSDGSEVPIELLKSGDMILGFEPSSAFCEQLIASCVTQTFVNYDRDVIEFHGLKVTPGHLFLSGTREFHQLVSILVSDDTIVANDGLVLRARTNQVVGSREDCVVPVVAMVHGEERVLKLRAGVPFARLELGGPIYTLVARMSQEGYRLRDDGLFENDAGDVRMADWPWGDPREHPVARDYVVGEPWEIAPTPVLN